jgi:hypothetical protein
MENINKYKRCYNCTGANMRSTCGFPMFGCVLCKTYGDGKGNLLEEYYNEEVKITVGKTEQVFTPPNYKCLECKDSFVVMYEIYDEDCVDDGCSDPCAFMPKVKARCEECNPECNIPTRTEQKDRYFECKKKFLEMGKLYVDYFDEWNSRYIDVLKKNLKN